MFVHAENYMRMLCVILCVGCVIITEIDMRGLCVIIAEIYISGLCLVIAQNYMRALCR